ncbi:hypothetical protein PSU4_29100 [Pseudonocardia sulfidoxydans NBRC 16205]|uniref:Uncharacterized protein n=1 Tax=Pseudonocardia sulfidoxydans NBRC 16205 TaxID=1223511 RepID=A0A511DGP6_9PSEU|nr:hypothetical protein PSU4_29100 [Pseudonocardia sulfidoxydans NBRC 16205]
MGAGGFGGGHRVGDVPVSVRGPVGPRLRLLLGVLAAVAALTAGCAQTPQNSTTSAQASRDSSPTAQREDVVDKLTVFAKDECATQDATQVYPQCARFAREVANATVAARAAAHGPAEEAAVTAAANSVDGSVDRLTQGGCLLPPGQGPASDPAVCGPALASLQDSLRALRTAFGA